jgi:hypothetical protein
MLKCLGLFSKAFGSHMQSKISGILSEFPPLLLSLLLIPRAFSTLPTSNPFFFDLLSSPYSFNCMFG